MLFFKEQLLQTGYVEDNEYLDLYVQLVNANIKTKREKFKTQCHHCIPCACYESRSEASKDPLNLQVNLLFKDHILAHYYLCLCAKDISFKYKMIAAIEFTLGKSNNVSNQELTAAIKAWLLNNDKFQEAYEEYAQIRFERLHNPEVREKAKQKLLGHATSEETRRKISEAQKGKPKNVSIDGRRRIAAAHKGKSSWNKGLLANNAGKKAMYLSDTLEIIYVLPEQVEEYVSKGWILGNPKCGRTDGSGTRNRKVICLETSVVFDTLKEAAESCKIVPSAIHQCLKGKSKTAGGYHWEYYIEN